MKRQAEITGYLLVLFLIFVLVFTGYITPAKKNPVATLNVPHIAQQGSYWCWAAATEMVTTYLHRQDPEMYPIITQCELVQQYFDSLRPPDTTLLCPLTTFPVDAQHDVMGSPFGNSWLYAYTTWGITPPSIATLDSLFSLEKPQPVIFTGQIQGAVPKTYDTGANAHYLVAEGMASSPYNFGRAWVTVNDPEPVLGGHHEIITYVEFAGIAPIQDQQGHFADSVHFIDSYNKQYMFYGWGGGFYNFQRYEGASK
jgi:hypothetical protein